MNTYRVFYIRDGKLNLKTITDTVQNIVKNYEVLYLTNLSGGVIIDHRMR